MIKVFLVCLACCCSSLMPLKQSESIVSEDHIQVFESKTKSNLYTDYGYFVLSICDLCSNDFINSCIDVYSPASVIYSPPYVDFSFPMLGDIFTGAKLVGWDNVNSTDLGYSTGQDITDVSYYYRTSGTSNYNTYLLYDLYINNTYYARFELFYYSTSSVQLYGVGYNIRYQQLGSYVVLPNSVTNTMYDVLYGNKNNQSYQFGWSDGYNEGQVKGYNVGYSEGVTYAQEQSSTALTIFTGIIEVGLLPVNVFLKMFEYEVFGINIAGFVSALLTIALVVIIIRVVTGKKND